MRRLKLSSLREPNDGTKRAAANAVRTQPTARRTRRVIDIAKMGARFHAPECILRLQPARCPQLHPLVAPQFMHL